MFCMQHVPLTAQVVAKRATDATLWQFLGDFLMHFAVYCLHPWPAFIPEPCTSSAAASQHGGSIKSIARSESGLPCSAREISGAHWGGKRMGAWSEYRFVTPVSWLLHSLPTSALARLPSASQPLVRLTTRPSSSLPNSHHHVFGFWPSSLPILLPIFIFLLLFFFPPPCSLPCQKIHLHLQGLGVVCLPMSVGGTYVSCSVKPNRSWTCVPQRADNFVFCPLIPVSVCWSGLFVFGVCRVCLWSPNHPVQKARVNANEKVKAVKLQSVCRCPVWHHPFSKSCSPTDNLCVI